LRAGGPGAAASFAAAIVAASVLGAVLVQAAANERDHDADRARAEADAARFQSELRTVTAVGRAVAAEATAGDAAFRLAARSAVDAGEARAVALLSFDGDVRTIVADRSVRPIAEGRAAAGLGPTIRAAVATDSPRLGPVLELDDGLAVVAVSPVHATDATTAAVRRSTTHSLTATIVPLADLRRPTDGPALWPGADVQVVTDDGRVGTAVEHPLLEAPVLAGDQVWRLRVGRQDDGWPLSGWAVFLAGLLAAAIGYVVLRRQHDQRRLAETEADVRSRQLEMIAGTSAALQQSLELADLLPAFCVSVVEEFHLSGASVFVTDDAGQLVEVFRLDHDTSGDVTTTFELRRGWRAVGRLVTRARTELDEVDVQSLQALADLLAVAVSNAELYQREQQAVSRLSELDALKNAFLGTVSHELRTSTTAVQGFGELLTEHWDTLPEERRRELAARIRRQAGSLRHLVDDLLDYARLEGHSLRVTPRHLSLTDLVRQLAESMSPLVAEHDVVFATDGDITAWADPIAVERILANLLSNAGKYSPAGTTVTVGVQALGDRARLWVSDQGPGIPTEERRRVFVRFYRLSNAATVRTRGAGIGLSILHDFAERSDAQVTIDDAPGGGALITVDFPTAPAAPDDADVLAGAES
jgi:signal transduction histidine kinase